MSNTHKEAEEMSARYARRASLAERYNPLRTSNLLAAQERDRVVAQFLQKHLGERNLSELEILEVGCGSGDNLLQLLRMGADPRRLRGNDLLPERLASARLRLPEATALLSGDAQSLNLKPGSLDLVLQYTVFSSILAPDVRHDLAEHMKGWLKPGGAIIWYDFTFDNPKNADVTGIRLSEIKTLFAGYHFDIARVTLAPPLARRFDRLPLLHNLFCAIPLLRTHVVCLIVKPTAASS